MPKQFKEEAPKNKVSIIGNLITHPAFVKKCGFVEKMISMYIDTKKDKSYVKIESGFREAIPAMEPSDDEPYREADRLLAVTFSGR